MSLRTYVASLFCLSLVMASPAWGQDPLADPVATAQEALERGAAALQREDYRAALDAAEEVLQISQTAGAAYTLQGHALQGLEDYQGAIKAYTRGIELNAGTAEAYNGRGECYLEDIQPQYELALNDFYEALDMDRSNPAALSNRGHVLVALQQPESALRDLEDAAELEPDNGRTFRDLALAHAMLNDFDEALVQIQRSIEVDPDDYQNYGILASVRDIQEDYALEIEAISTAIAKYQPDKRNDPPAFLEGYLRRAAAQLKLGNTLDDEEQRRTAFELVVNDANAVIAQDIARYTGSGYLQRGRAQRMLERFSEAIDSLTRAIQSTSPEDTAALSGAYFYRGICWYYQGALDLARQDFIEASGLGEGFQDPRIYLWIGFTYHKEENYRQAIDNYGEAAALNPSFALAHVNRGLAYMMLNEYRMAIDSFNKAIRAEPLEPEHFYMVGIAQMNLGEFKKASDAFTHALLKDNSVAKYHRAMAAALREMGEDSLAATYEQQAAELDG